jgi:hypothetical protein
VLPSCLIVEHITTYYTLGNVVSQLPIAYGQVIVP